ncbi:MAG: peptidase [Magnetococcales bacterium]|nr:peptidase [Magnetococcales bacterium]
MNTILQLPIFKVGRHTDMSGATLEITEADLEQTVAAYLPSRHEAPLVVGHPQHDAPAWGWVSTLTLLNGILWATPHQVDPSFAKQVASGRYKKISASFYTPNAPSNPYPGVYYLRHVGFLGAQPPAIKGLPDASFREAEPGVVVWETTTDWSEQTTANQSLPPITHTMENKMAVLPETETPSAAEAELQRKMAALDHREAQFAEREKQLQLAETNLKRQQTLATSLHFVEELIQEGRILPRQREGLAAFLANLDETGQVEFAEPAPEGSNEPVMIKTSPRAYINRFLKELPLHVDYQERSAEGGEKEESRSFAAPEGYAIDGSGLEMHRKILAYAKKHNLDFASALAAAHKPA